MIDGRIVALDDDALDSPSARTQVVDLAGGCIVPGFRDGHAHPLWGARSLLGAPVSGAATLADLLDRVRSYAAAHPQLEWVTGAGYDPTLLPGGVGDARLLDHCAPGRPVFLWATDHHAAWVSSAALDRAAITERSIDPPRGRIVRRDDGSPAGTLLEAAAHGVAALVPPPAAAELRGALGDALTTFAAAGVTWVQDAALQPEETSHYLALASDGPLPCGVQAALVVDPEHWRDQLDAFSAARAEHASSPIRTPVVKFFADGVIEASTAAMLEPYCGCDARGTERGISNWPVDEMGRAVSAFDALGFQVHIHAIGDGAVRSALDAIERASRLNGTRDRRPTVAHTQLVQPADLARFAQLGAVANFEPLWAQRDALMIEFTEPRLGPLRSSWQYPMGALSRAGVAISFGSDWPVSSLAPLDGLAVAVTRQTRNREPEDGWLPEQRLGFGDALAAYTTGTAYQAFDESGAGRLAPGAPADLCLLAVDPARVDPHDLPEVNVLGTWHEGDEVFRA